MITEENRKTFGQWLTQQMARLKLKQTVLGKNERTIRNVEVGKSLSRKTYEEILTKLNSEMQKQSPPLMFRSTWEDVQRGKLPDEVPFGRQSQTAGDLPEPADTASNLTPAEISDLAERTGYAYRSWQEDRSKWPGVISFLEKRYGVDAFKIGGDRYDIAVLWQCPPGKTVKLDDILGECDLTQPKPQASERERGFIKLKFTQGDIKHESINYTMRTIDLSKGRPRIHGGLGLYYDNVLSQMALRWELCRALIKNAPLVSRGVLPRREEIEIRVSSSDVLRDGRSRCATIFIQTLYVIEIDKGKYVFTAARRAKDVGMWPGKYGLVPSGAFEHAHPQVAAQKEWSMRRSLMRELGEEVYGLKELMTPESPYLEYVEKLEPMKTIASALRQNPPMALLSVLAVSIDLTTLAPEISTVLVVRDKRIRDFPFNFNWEWDKLSAPSKYGRCTIDVRAIPEFLNAEGRSANIVPASAVTLQLGYEWLKAHGIV